MATPRIFISSTCYDLQEIRFQLRKFIDDIGYDPVMSDFGDIFYDLKSHVQDSCKEEISKCNIFVLIVGNNYGSIYHNHAGVADMPDSVTLQEFRKALAVGVPKYIFINKFVQHDFENYRRSLSKYIAKYYSENNVDDSESERVKNGLKLKYDASYPFANDSYMYVFHFLDLIYQVDTNNALYPFESFDEIKETLKKQWAGYFYDSLTKQTTIGIEKIEVIETKLDKIEAQLRKIAEGKTSSIEGNNITIDISKLATEIDIEDLEAIQHSINSSLETILKEGRDKRVEIRERFTAAKAMIWLDNLGGLLKQYKWSQTIPVIEVFKGNQFVYWKNRQEIPFRSILELQSIYSKFGEDDKQSLSQTVCMRLNDYYKPEPEPKKDDDDLPF